MDTNSLNYSADIEEAANQHTQEQQRQILSNMGMKGSFIDDPHLSFKASHPVLWGPPQGQIHVRRGERGQQATDISMHLNDWDIVGFLRLRGKAEKR